MSLPKTNAVRLLEQAGIVFELRDYEVDEDDLSALTVARKVGMPPARVFKTLVARGDRNGVCLAVLPGDAQLDLKSLAKATGDKKVETVPLKEVQPLTGYVRGGVTAIGCKRAFPVVVDVSIGRWDIVSISAGARGLQVLLSPADYLRLTGASVAAIARVEPPGGPVQVSEGSS